MELLNPSTFKSYPHAAAGHKGTMSDESDEFFIKPSTQKEIDFYNEVKAHNSPLENVIPNFFGSLGLLGPGSDALPLSVLGGTDTPSQPELFMKEPKNDPNADPNEVSVPSEVNPELYAHISAIANGQQNSDVHGRSINSSQFLVLENLTGGFAHPNVMDIKLGSRLWDDDAAEDKRKRLDGVAKSTTSIEKNFRVAGIRLYTGENPSQAYLHDPFPWRTITGLTGLRCADDTLNEAFSDAAANYGHLYKESVSKTSTNGTHASEGTTLLSFTSSPENVLVHTKHYGRAMLSWDIFFVLERFICVKGAQLNWTQANITLQYFVDECKAIKAALEASETRMYSPSILLVYEGDGIEFERKLKYNESLDTEGHMNHPADSSDEDDDGPIPEKLFELRLIDFAHARFTPGQGPDTNIIKGVDNLIKHLEVVLIHAERRAGELFSSRS